ncbi:MAG: DegT/DnrJ/EryC1/StrS family aminotransferase [Aulosira sp. ZfuVER01]|nr:DegT/DnrJ/EryC1/StrS family aminotransferase [Aulosira sp. ZfuVER01]MDZ8000785.1 DegT/DnrJ/EryC1/StrS family aminotransferase [Aulosira sp. DedVER01a]MDZ8055094.1 DegT/DnrJ/EryC1/StrS family aminotransferase [Aulosira sp. ZfuCHP01]
MNKPTLFEENLVTLPSDQEASGRTLGEEELTLISEVLYSGILNSTKGNFVKELEKKFADLLGVKYVYACASGSGAIHTAIAAIDPEPGDEIVTTSITDMGALTPILYQGAIPVFADVDPRTWNVTAETIEASLSDRTKAIIVTHLFGNPCNMSEIMELAQSRNIPVIEDCAQAFLAEHNGQNIGAIGAIGCFSLQQGKHITTGEGGLVTTNHDALARRMFLFINKAWGYGDSQPDHYFLALNYRMTELQGAVAVAQLAKLASVVQNRISAANKLTEKLQGLPGIETPWIDPRNIHTYWKYCLRVDHQVLPGGAVGLAQRLKEKGIASAPRYIQKPAFMCEIFQKQQTFGNSHFPFTLARPEAVDYDRSRFPGTFAGLESVLVLPWNERYTEEHINYIAKSLHQVIDQLRG